MMSFGWNYPPPSNTSGFVPYVGATQNVDLGVFSITANSFIKAGGLSTQFLKADGSVDSNTYITASALTGYVPYTGATANVDLGAFSLISPQIIGGSASGGTLTIDSTSNATKGAINFGTVSSDNVYNFNVGSSSALVRISGRVGATSQAAIYFNQASPAVGNAALYGLNTTTILNCTSGGTVNIANGGSSVCSFTNTGMSFTPLTVSAGSITSFTFTKPNNTGQTASTNIQGFLFTTGSRQWNTGSITTQQEFLITSPTYSFASASTITDAYTLYVNAPTAGTNATITNNWAIGTNGRVNVQGSSSDLINVGTNDGGFYNIKLAYNGVIGSTTGAGQLGNLGANALGFYLPTSATGMSRLVNTWTSAKISYEAYQHHFQFFSSANQTAEYSRFLVTGNQVNFTAAIATQRFNYFTAPTIAFNSANTVTNSYSLYVEAAIAGTNATITNNYAAGFSGSVDIVTGNLNLLNTTSSTTGVITKAGVRFIHDFAAAGTTGQNTWVGVNAGNFTLTGSSSGTQGGYNVAVGHSAGFSITTGNFNALLGHSAGSGLTTGAFNVMLGRSAGGSVTTGGSNIYIGEQAATSNTSGNNNVVIGHRAAQFPASSFSNSILIGYLAGYASSASNVVFVGFEAGRNNTSGATNTAIGYQALYTNQTGASNVAIGNLALYQVTTSSNVAVGSTSLYDVTSGANNIALGSNSGRGIATGQYNVIIGHNVTGLSATLSNNILLATDNGVTRFRYNPQAGSGGLFQFTPASTTGQTASTEIPTLIVNAATTTLAQGALTTQRFFYLPSQTLAFAAASTATNVYGLFVESPTVGTNATITNRYAAGFSGGIEVTTGNSLFRGVVTIARGIDANVTNFSVSSGTANTSVFSINTDQPNSSILLTARNSTTLNLGTQDAIRMSIDTSGNIICGVGAIATNATNGFLYVPSCAGIPTGVPTTVTGRVPIVADSTNNKLYIYSGGAWVALN